jgi:hypothetical protein
VSLRDPTTNLRSYRACFSGNVTNLDFVEYLLEVGADPNAQERCGKTLLLSTTPDTPSAAKFLLSWPTTDVNIISRDGESFQAKVRSTIAFFQTKLHSLIIPTRSRTNSSSSSGVKSKRYWCWRKQEPLIPLLQPLSRGLRQGMGLRDVVFTTVLAQLGHSRD